MLQYWSSGKKVSRRVPQEKVDLVKSDLKKYGYFKGLVEEFVEVTEQIALQEDGIEGSKKNEMKSRRKGFERPKRS